MNVKKDYTTGTNGIIFALLRSALTGETFRLSPRETEWAEAYEMADMQSVLGVCFETVKRLDQSQQPPFEVLMQWTGDAELQRKLNKQLNTEAARLTDLFAAEGRQTAILKGQANARLYPDKLSRQPGDIDIWVEGGRESVIALLRKMGLTDDEQLRAFNPGHATVSYHHVHLPTNDKGIDVEVHFRPSSGNICPWTNRRLQRYVEQEIRQVETVDEGFCVPTLRFALIMQLAHIQRHYLSGGIGLRQLCDYYLLLRNATEPDRQEVSAHLRRFGLRHIAGAVMWVLQEVLGLDERLMLCAPDDYRGPWMLRETMAGGNFGWYKEKQDGNLWRNFFKARIRQFRMLPFDFCEMSCIILDFWKTFIESIPYRIKYRTLSLNNLNSEEMAKVLNR